MTNWAPDTDASAVLDRLGGPFDSTGFRGAVEATTAWRDASVTASLPDGTVAALAVLKRMRVGVSVPFGYGGVSSSRPLSTAEQTAFLRFARKRAAVRWIDVRSVHFDEVGQDTSVVRLVADCDPVESFHKKAKYSVRRAARDGLAVRATNDPEPFLRLYAGEVTRFATEYSSALIREAAERGAARFFVASVGDEDVAASTALRGASHWMYWLGAQNDAGRRHSASYLSVAELLREAARSGVPFVNLGASRADGDELRGVVAFKLRLGGVEVTASEQVVADRVGRVQRQIVYKARKHLRR